jgi:hypothetical protein
VPKDASYAAKQLFRKRLDPATSMDMERKGTTLSPPFRTDGKTIKNNTMSHHKLCVIQSIS